MGGKRVTSEQFEEEVQTQGNGRYQLVDLTLYKTSKTPMEIIHLDCKHEYTVRRDDFIGGKRCPECAGNIKRTLAVAKKDLKKVVGNEYTITDKKYISSQTPMEFRHTECGRTFKTSFNNLYSNGSTCIHCYHDSKRIILTDEEYADEVNKVHGVDEYTILESYQYKTMKLLTQHNVCGHKWRIDPFHLVDERNGCPLCHKIAKEESKYVKMVMEILSEKEIYSIREQKLFKNPETDRFLYADFYVPSYNLVIEYDGKQHFLPMFNDVDKLKKQINRDLIKDRLLEENSVHLLRIPYKVNKKQEIEKVINDKLNFIGQSAAKLPSYLVEERSTTIQRGALCREDILQD